MIYFGLPNETIEHDPALGEVLVSVDKATSVVTFIFSTNLKNNRPPLLYSIISTVYDVDLFDNLLRTHWVSSILQKWGQKYYFDDDLIIRSNASEPFVVQAVAFANIETLTKRTTHDK